MCLVLEMMIDGEEEEEEEDDALFVTLERTSFMWLTLDPNQKGRHAVSNFLDG